MTDIQNVKSQLQKVLSIAEYPDSEKYIQDFIDMTVKEALLDVTDDLSEEKEKEIQDALATTQSPEELLEKVVSLVDQKLLQEKLASRAENAMKGLLDAIIPRLDPTQAKELVKALQ